ncbi:DNA-3-methyladenine glycosylase 2 family protein [Acidithrix sp. C25]|uniref:DNA-3-methyladenine glycosylase family protein n=1 Tax=Acidithrix sp. C25 TaxID=1671482 RepID=UPI00191B9E10|nr:DNA-3-methyladenine glycosylase 2 family protein [Acidithrix sp. C25]
MIDPDVEFFLRSHPEFAGLYNHFGVPGFLTPNLSFVRSSNEIFASLVRTVVHQQLSGAVASVFDKRIQEAASGDVSPEKVLALSFEGLRALGLSNSKSRSILELAQKVYIGELDLIELVTLDEAAISSSLCGLYGFGPWSAQMFLLFDLGKRNVWAPADLGVRKGFRILYGLDDLPSIPEMTKHGERYSPLASLATWYLWRVLELPKSIS